jgi:hypothetical protein
MTEDQFNKAKDNRADKRQFIMGIEELQQIYKLKDASLELKRACDIGTAALEQLIRMYDDAFNKI